MAMADRDLPACMHLTLCSATAALGSYTLVIDALLTVLFGSSRNSEVIHAGELLIALDNAHQEAHRAMQASITPATRSRHGSAFKGGNPCIATAKSTISHIARLGNW